VLAWFGAEVVKIENPGWHPGRRLRPGARDDPGTSTVQRHIASWRSTEIAEGARDRRERMKKADVTVENMAPGTIEPSADYEFVKKINPGIIYCQIKGFGTGSPHEAAGLRHDRAGRWRPDQRHWRARPPAGQAGLRLATPAPAC
jgi:formyl-CoA transferase